MATTWKRESIPKKEYPPLRENIETDIAIIGGGITGLLNAYLLAKAGRDVALFEADTLGHYATLETTAFLTRVIDTSLSEIARAAGESTARLVWDSGQKAIEAIEAIIKEEKIDCDFMRCPAYIYASTKSQLKQLQSEYAEYSRLSFPVKFRGREALPFLQFGALEIPDQAKFDPAKFIFALSQKAEARGARIFEKTEIIAIEGDKPILLRTRTGQHIRARDAIIATYRPILNEKMLFKKGMYRTYVLELEIRKSFPEAIYFDLSNPYYYFRIDRQKKKDRVIIGGEDHRDELSRKGLKEESFKSLEKYAKTVFKKYEVITRWDGPILEPSDGLALIGEIKPHHYVATAFSGNGITYAMISALLFEDLIEGRENPWRRIYDPARPLVSKKTLFKARDYAREFFGGAVKNLTR